MSLPQPFSAYKIVERLGKGRFAEVYRATKLDLNREVALKILLPEWEKNAEARKQFFRQAQLIARLRHPRIVEVLDLGEENGRLFMAMEYFPQGSLRRWIDEHQGEDAPPLWQIAAFIEDAAAALDFVHSQQTRDGQPMVHGDIHPGNLLVREETGELRVSLSDLGLLNALQDALTLSGSVALPRHSPRYISPEQADDLPPTPRSDQYALALVAYEALTGKPPFDADSAVTLYRMHRKATPPRPSEQRTGLPLELDAVLLKALSKNPANRFASCEEFSRALRRAIEAGERKRFEELLERARALLAEGKGEDALSVLEKVRQLAPASDEACALYEEAQKRVLAARQYQEAREMLRKVQEDAVALQEAALPHEDSEGLLQTFAPPPPPRWKTLAVRFRILLLAAAAGLVLAAFASLNYSASHRTTQPAFQTQIAPFWTASPTASPTATPTFTPTPTPTFTPTPLALNATQVANGVVLLQRLQGHSNWVRSVAFSPDGTLLASGSNDSAIRLWNVQTDKTIKVLRGHSEWITSIAFSPDGALLASSSADGTIRLWNVQTGGEIQVLKGHSDWVRSVAFSPDGALLASGSYDHTIRLWSVPTGETVAVLQGHWGTIRSVAFSPDGALLASGSADGTIRLWNVQTGEEIQVLKGHSAWVYTVAFSPNGALLASGSYDRTIRLWSVQTDETIKVLRGHSEWVYSVAFSPDGALLASGSKDGTIRLWNVQTGETVAVLRGNSEEVNNVAFSPNGWWLASGHENGDVLLWGISRWNTTETPSP